MDTLLYVTLSSTVRSTLNLSILYVKVLAGLTIYVVLAPLMSQRTPLVFVGSQAL